jgi:hypothetical protein
LAEKLIQFWYGRKRIKTSKKGFVRFCQLGGALSGGFLHFLWQEQFVLLAQRVWPSRMLKWLDEPTIGRTQVRSINLTIVRDPHGQQTDKLFAENQGYQHERPDVEGCKASSLSA